MAVKMHTVVPWDIEVFLLLNLIMYIGLFVWSKVGARSFRMFQMSCVLMIPFIIALLGRAWVFISFWIAYVGCAAYIVRLAFQRPVTETTPKQVYLFFTGAHQVCYSMSIVGLVLLFSRTLSGGDLGARILLLSMYFGVVNRDGGTVAAERMRPAIRIGEDKKRSRHVAANTCGICSQRLRDVEGGQSPSQKPQGEAVSNSNQNVLLSGEIVDLPCRHSFHGHCIRGWYIIGKRTICPVCGEKVDLMTSLQQKPWIVTSFLYSFLVGIGRFIMVWNPLVLIFSGYGLYAIEKVTGRL
ncbi:hypothetical protein NDN08_004273 [Rhodosorus marinus]|uniref:RING-type domain-containing protein n=1 Tax=Rhodosorus marinus TaxID=101924 RepID=A0AAV8UPQ0_9RHOD|nr:hypothetical protein NDN08_004273 [Rhodosorus marinus]